MATHEVFNQPPPLEGYDVFGQDQALVDGLHGEGAGWAEDELRAIGGLAGSAEVIRWGFDANRFTPELRAFDRFGNRIDEVEYHPSYHQLMAVAVERGLHASPWRDRRAGAHVARAAGFYVWSQVDAGHGCPISMTYSILPALAAQPELVSEWEPLLTSPFYDPSARPASLKSGGPGRYGHDRKAGRQ
jgi:putative acyl-CoA dehydrogenase